MAGPYFSRWTGEEIDDAIGRARFLQTNGGVGSLVMEMESLTGMTTWANQRQMWRDKLTNTLYIYALLVNNTGSTVAANTPLLRVPAMDSDYTDIVLSFLCFVQVSGGNITGYETAHIKYDSLNDYFYICSPIAIPDGSRIVIHGSSKMSQLASGFFSRNLYPSALAADIIDAFFHGYGANTWQMGDFTYSQDVATRLDPTQRATDCTGIIWMAYNSQGIHPKGSVSQTIFSDGIVLSAAPSGEALDLSMGMPGDIIAYEHLEGGVMTFSHCTLYLGNDTVGEMSVNYRDAEGTTVTDGGNTYTITNRKGPYRIPLSAATYKNDYNRYLIRFL